jgi:hypothetical protein
MRIRVQPIRNARYGNGLNKSFVVLLPRDLDIYAMGRTFNIEFPENSTLSKRIANTTLAPYKLDALIN